MKTIRAAGGLVFFHGSSAWEVLLIQDRKGFWTFPKGHMEEGETEEQTALREVAEETGITDVSVVTQLIPVSYTLPTNRSITKTVAYFLCVANTRQIPVVQTEEGLQSASWTPVSAVMDLLGYKETNVPLFIDAVARLSGE